MNEIQDEFWLDNFKILFQTNRLSEFFPSPKMTLEEKLNAIMRFGIYSSIILILLFKNYLYLYILIGFMIFTTLIYKFSNNDLKKKYQKEEFKPFYDDIPFGRTVPSKNNPFMNINLITDPKNKPEAAKSYNNEKIRNMIENNFDTNLYKDVGDLYSKSNNQREYYTMPSTTLPNDQTSFAKWCYLVPPTCKENTLYCAPYVNDPSQLDTSDTIAPQSENLPSVF
jgi:hypothetical protein